MQVANVCTEDPTLRSEIDSYTYEDSSLFVRKTYGPKSSRGWWLTRDQKEGA